MLGVWIETDETVKYGIAIYNFHDVGQNKLSLDVGDTVNIICHCEGWFYGYCTKDRTRMGIFPKEFVCIRNSVIDLTGCYLPKELPIVQEITAVLREWGVLWKELYLHSKGSIKTDSDVIHKTMLELIDFRRLIMARKLTVDELKDMQQKVTNKIDMGNARLGLDLVVRDEHGNIIDPLKTSSISLYRMHQLATKRIEEEKEMMADRHVPKKAYSFNLYVNVKNFVCRIGENADILLTLYDAKDGQFISDNYIMKWGNQGMPQDLDMLNNLRVIFTDLSVKDTSREKVFLVCQIIRIGRMDLKEADSKKLAKGMRRPFGVAAVEVNDILNGKVDSDEEKQYFIPFLQCGEHDFMDNVIKKAITAKDINHKGQGLWVTMRKLLGDLAQVQKEYPHLVTSTTAVARKMGFPDVIMPGCNQ
jgi:dedicator of cytokinesis protein 1